MSDLTKLFWFFPKDIVYLKLKDEQSRQALKVELEYTNLIRLRSLLYIIGGFVVFLLIIDMLLGNMWDDKTLKRFIVMDIIILIIVLIVQLILQYKYPIIKGQLNKYHPIILKVSLIIFMSWISFVSANEINSSNGLPSFVIGCFAISTFFLLRSGIITIILLSALFSLWLGLFFLGLDPGEILTLYFPTFFLVFIAFFVSRILYRNYINTFVANLELNKTNEHLDELVKQRTLELSEMNSKLEFEIKERLNYEQRLRKEKRKVEEADQLKSAFLANMSHEIRTPLNGIVGFSDLLGRTNLPDEKRERYITVIKSNSNQLIQLIDDIIDISMIESNQLKFNFSKICILDIYSTIKDFYKNNPKAQQTKEVEFITEIWNIDKELTLTSDDNRILQVIYNLIGNAYKFTKKGYIKFSMRRDETDLFIYVEDTGIGITKDKAMVIFERFRQVDETPNKMYGGTGLGLSISKGIIQHLKGEIWLDPIYQTGSRFCFSLPIINSPEQNEKVESLKIKGSITNRKDILIQTKDPDFQKSLKDIFITEKIMFGNNIDITLKKYAGKKFDLLIFAPDLDEIKNNAIKQLKPLLKHENSLITITGAPDVIGKIKNDGCRFVYLQPLNIVKFIRDIQAILC
jgi:signal transduction histidine kinase